MTAMLKGGDGKQMWKQKGQEAKVAEIYKNKNNITSKMKQGVEMANAQFI